MKLCDGFNHVIRKQTADSFPPLQSPETPVWEDSHSFPGVQLDSSTGGPCNGLRQSWGCLHFPPRLWGAHTRTGGWSLIQLWISIDKGLRGENVFICAWRPETGTRSCRPPGSCHGRTYLRDCCVREPFSRCCRAPRVFNANVDFILFHCASFFLT